MTIDKRLEKLVERHEALTESVELLLSAQEDTAKKFKETDRKIERVAALIRDLARIAKSHEDRLDALEGGKA